MNEWLASFASHIDIGYVVVLVAGAIALMAALFTISYQTFKAAVVSPVSVLKSE